MKMCIRCFTSVGDMDWRRHSKRCALCYDRLRKQEARDNEESIIIKNLR